MTTTAPVADPITEAERGFRSTTANHQMTVLRDDGVYRHLRFKAPDTGFYWFDLVTWPGHLSITGDTGSYTFARTDDMFAFFRTGTGINPHYWAEKLPDGRKSVREYSEDVLRAALAESTEEYEKDYVDRLAKYREAKANYDARPLAQRWSFDEPVEPKSPDEVRELINDHDADGLLTYEAGARQLLDEMEKAGIVSDTWEWTLTDWSYHYLWCCHAIRWGIEQYDNARGEASAG